MYVTGAPMEVVEVRIVEEGLPRGEPEWDPTRSDNTVDWASVIEAGGDDTIVLDLCGRVGCRRRDLVGWMSSPAE